MKCDVVIKTWKPDLPWLAYCLRFLRKNWQERSSGIVILANEDCREGIASMHLNGDSGVSYFRGERVYYVRPWPDTYNFHMYVTMRADDFTDADLLLFVDSDLMLVEPASLDDFTTDGKPIIYYQRTAELEASKSPELHVHCRTWYPIMQEFFGHPPTRDYMTVFPMIYWAGTIQAVRRAITHKNGLGVEDALYSTRAFQPAAFVNHKFTFCDYEILGMWADINESYRYCFVHASEQPRPKTKLYHSWTEWNSRTQIELERMLASNVKNS
jgi:hypothetical protein